MATEYVAMSNDAIKNIDGNSLYVYQIFFGKFQSGGSATLKDGINAEMCFSLGLPILISLMLIPMCYKKISKEKRSLYIFAILLGTLTTFMATNLFQWSKIPKVFSIIQFPWRMLLFSTFLFSIIAGINICIFTKDLKNSGLFIIIMIILMYAGNYMSDIIKFKPDFDPSMIVQNTNISNVLGADGRCCGEYEYLPVKAKNVYTQNRSKNVIVLSGNAKIENEEKNGPNLYFDITSNAEESTLELPYIYYLGYNIKLNGKEIDYQESEHGFISIKILKDEIGKIEVTYSGTKVSKICTCISIIGTMLFVIYVIVYEIKLRRAKIKNE